MIRPSAFAIVSVAGLAAGALAQPAGPTVRGPSTQQDPYMVPANPAVGVVFHSIATNGTGTAANPNDLFLNQRTGAMNYSLVGVPDGMGALRLPLDLELGTFTLLCNHEAGDASGIVRAHGSKGAFVSSWTLRYTPGTTPGGGTFAAVGAKDLADTVYLYDTASNAFFPPFNTANPMPRYQTVGNPATDGVLNFTNPDRRGWGRHCSADLAEPGAYRWVNPETQEVFGTDARIFMNGEEIGATGRAAAYIVTGPEAGTAWELPALADFSWENSVASPFPQRKTIVMGADDATPGNIYFYVGQKQSTGNTIERAGLTGGLTYGIAVAGVTVNGSGQPVEDRNFALGTAANGRRTIAPFTMVNLGDQTEVPGPTLQTMGDAAGVVNFLRPEDAAWDPSNPARCYFVTTDSFSGNSRLWSITFSDILNPELGGMIEMLGDGSVPSSFAGGIVSATGTNDIRMMDNFGINRFGQILIQEDVGNNPRLGRLWMYEVASDSITEVGVSNPARFIAPPQGQTNPNFLTQDEETSGIIDATDVVGPGWWLLNMQAHYANNNLGGELIEGGQLLAVYIPRTVRPASNVADIVSIGGFPPADGQITVDDYTTFINAFAADDLRADIVSIGGFPPADEQLTVDDYTSFINAFAQGG